jgi:hypothetical protein
MRLRALLTSDFCHRLTDDGRPPDFAKTPQSLAVHLISSERRRSPKVES